DSRSAREPRPAGTSQRTELRARRHHQHHSSYAPDQPERHETPDPGRSDAVNSRFQGVRPASGWHPADIGLASGRRRAGVVAAVTPTAVSIRAGGGRDGHNGRVIDELIARMAAM